MHKTIKTVDYHIKGKPLAEKATSMTDPNYVEAELYYKTGSGYILSISPVTKFLTNGVPMKAVAMHHDTLDLFHREGILLGQAGKKREAEAIRLFDAISEAYLKNYKLELEFKTA